MINKEGFIKKFNIDNETFKENGIEWSNLIAIYNDYLDYKNKLTHTSESISNILRQLPEAHSVRSRIKVPEHLLDKIIRKTIRERITDEKYKITLENYKTEITDLIGVRVIHLYKDDAFSIDTFIRKNWKLVEQPTINYRNGDQTPENTEFTYKEHPYGYRSWHYLIKSQTTLEPHIVELQVRTLFEEGWSEIDHQLRYPNNTHNPLLTQQLLVLNRLAGSADEMANSIIESQKIIGALNTELENREEIILSLKNEVTKSKDQALKKSLETKIRKLEESDKRQFNLASHVVIGDIYHGMPRIDSDALKILERGITLPPDLTTIQDSLAVLKGLNIAPLPLIDKTALNLLSKDKLSTEKK